jgi:ribosomal protein S12 methylthiotransferase accessory factor YcaO
MVVNFRARGISRGARKLARTPTLNEKKYPYPPRLVAQRQRQGFLASVTWVRASACTSVIPAVSYLSTGLARYSVGPEISCGARKLARTPRITNIYIYIYISLSN